MEPPPAPIALTSIIGVAMWKPPASCLVDISGLSSTTMATSKEVPPMSVVMMLR
jgi:hypothetical protein